MSGSHVDLKRLTSLKLGQYTAEMGQ